MRDIKFRIRFRNKLSGVIVESYALLDDLSYKIGDIVWYQNSQWEVLSKDTYTGRKDKNGKEAYVGDIFHVTYAFGEKTKNAQVVWNEKELQYYLKELDQPLWYFRDNPIIGNIYENPELLEKEQEE